MSDLPKSIEITVIGTIRTPYLEIGNMPIQSAGTGTVSSGVVELFPEYVEGLLDLEAFSHVILLYNFHQQKGHSLKVIPFMDTCEHGVFATRSPKRPAHIGMSTVKIEKIEDNKIYFEGADMLDGTPLFDIKPFFRQFDNRSDARSGWLDEQDQSLLKNVRSDKRFQ